MVCVVAPKYVSENWQTWDHLDKVTFIQCLERTLTDWQHTDLYQRWCHHCRPWRYQQPLDPPLTRGEAYRLACDLHSRTLTL